MQIAVALSIVAITSGVNPGGVSTTTKSTIEPERRVDLAQELDRDDRGVVGPGWARAAALTPEEWVSRKPLSFSSSSEPPVRTRSKIVVSGADAHAEPDVAELEVEVDERDRSCRARRARPRARSTSASCPVPPFGPSTQMSGARLNVADSALARLARDRLLEREEHLVGGDGKDDHVVGAGREDAPGEAVRRAVAEHDDRPPRPLARPRRRSACSACSDWAAIATRGGRSRSRAGAPRPRRSPARWPTISTPRRSEAPARRRLG